MTCIVLRSVSIAAFSLAVSGTHFYELFFTVGNVIFNVFSCLVHKVHLETSELCIVTVADLFRESTKMTTCETVPKMLEFAF